MNYIILFTLVFLSTTSLIAADKNWQLILANGDTISEVYLQDLLDDLLICSNANLEFVYLISVDSIVEARTKEKSQGSRGAILGVLVKVTTVALFGWGVYKIPKPESIEGPGYGIDLGSACSSVVARIFGTITGLFIGGSIDYSYGDYEVYDLVQLSYEDKARFIQSQLKWWNS